MGFEEYNKLPRKSIIKNNIIEILFFLKKSYGYEIYKHYIKIFGKIYIRSMYDQLQNAVKTGELKSWIEREEGKFSWGNQIERRYYSLDNTKIEGNEKVKEYFEKYEPARSL